MIKLPVIKNLFAISLSFGLAVSASGIMPVRAASNKSDAATAAVCTSPSFGAAASFGTAAGPHAVATGYFNGDSNLDLATANYSNNTVSVLLGNGAGSFNAATHFSAGSGSISIKAADFNKDNISDLATANRNANSISVLLGNGDGSFGAASSFSVGTNPMSVNIGDFNKDGNIDLVAANSNSGTVSVLLGNGSGSFGPKTDFTVESEPYGASVGDFNADTHQDLAVVNRVSHTVSILLGTGTGSFGTATNFSVGAQFAPAITIGDFNTDSKLDIATANGGTANISVLLGAGNGSFGSAANFPVDVNPGALTANDFNGDNLPDLAVTNWNANNVSVLLGSSNGSFGAATNFTLGTNPTAVTTGDFNEDGKQDIAAANATSNTISILLNTCTDTIAPTVTINQADQPDPVTTLPVHFIATFSEPVYGFTGADVALSGTAAPTTVVLSELAPHDQTTFDIAVSGMTGQGTVIAAINADAAQDLAGNGNTASTSIDNTAIYQPVYAISGSLGLAGVTLTYIDGIKRTSISNTDGSYTITVPYNWSGTITPSKSGYLFTPVNKSYNDVQTDQSNQDYTATPLITINNPNTNPAQSKTITASVLSGTLTMNNTSDSTCGGTLTFTAYASQTFTSESDNGTKVCYKAVDDANNTAYSLSNPINGIDVTAPVITINNPGTNPAQSKTITAGASDGTLTMSNTTGSICDGTLIFTTYASHNFISESDNGKKVCYQAIDLAGNKAYQLSNAIAGIDTLAPNLAIIAKPANPTSSKTASFSFSGSDTGSGIARFECKLDGASFTTCTSPKAYASLTFGKHVFSVRAFDQAGNMAQATYTWKIAQQRLFNGSFNSYNGTSKIPMYWGAKNFSTFDGKDTTNANKKEGLASIKINGKTGISKSLAQTINLSGIATDSLTFSFWAKGAAIPAIGVCKANILLYDGSSLKVTKTIHCKTGSYGFTQNTLTFNASVPYTKIVVEFIYSKASGSIWLELASLLK